MMKNKAILSIFALTLIVGAFLFPLTAHAQTSDTYGQVQAEAEGKAGSHRGLRGRFYRASGLGVQRTGGTQPRPHRSRKRGSGH